MNRCYFVVLLFFIFFNNFFSLPESSENTADNLIDINTLQFSSLDENGEYTEFVKNIIESYENSCITGTRIFMESGEKVRYRYEFVIRCGNDKIVSLKMPYHVTWYRKNDVGFIIQNGLRTEVEVALKDLEDVLVEKIKNVRSDFYVTEINYSGIPAYYCFIKMKDDLIFRVIFLKSTFQIIRIERQSTSNVAIMLYDNLNDSDTSTFNNQINWYSDFPLGSEETATPEASDSNVDNTSEINKKVTEEIEKRFYSYLQNIKNEFQIIKSEMIEFSDAFALFLTITKDDSDTPIGLVILSPKEGISLKDIGSGSLIDKIPEGYESYQYVNDDVEINIMGEFPHDFLQAIVEKIIE